MIVRRLVSFGGIVLAIFDIPHMKEVGKGVEIER